MNTDKTVLDIIGEALVKIYDKTGIAVSEISADWIDVGSHGNPYQHALTYIKFRDAYVDQPGGNGR